MAVLAALALPLNAQKAGGQKKPTARVPPTRAPERHNLLGAWGGLRPWLLQRGIEPTLTLLSDASLVLDGGVNEGAGAFRSLFDAEFSGDGERLLGWRGSRFYVDLQVQSGPDGSQDTGDFQVYSNIDGPNRVARGLASRRRSL